MVAEDDELRRPLKANFVSTILFSWVYPLMKKSFKKNLSVDDLYEVSDNNSAEHLCNKLNREWQRELRRPRRDLRPSYIRALLVCFWKPLLVTGIALAVEEIAKVFQPLLLARMLHYFTVKDESGGARLCTYMYALAMVGTLIVISAASQLFEFMSFVIGMRMRVASCGLIYRKTLRLSQKALADATTGHIINLISTDAVRFDYVPYFLHYVWLAPIETAAVLAILWLDIGLASLPGFALILLVIPVQGYMGKLFAKLRLKMATRTDERLQLMDQVLAGMKVIKLYCWEKPFSKLVQTARRREMRLVKIVGYLTVMSTEIGYLTFARVAIGTFVLTLIWMRGTVPSLESVIVIIRLISTIQDSLVYFLPLSVQIWGELTTTCSRIQEFLLLEELSVRHISRCLEKETACLELRSYIGKWGGSEAVTVKDVTLALNSGELLAVVGPVGSGKSSLLMALLGELPRVSGELDVRGRVAYAAQQPWIYSASLRQNILFDLQYEAEKYSTIIEVCALDKDISLLPNGDRTLVGEKGVMLSGGQKARVSLARALYQDADIYLLDDPLSAVDAAVARHLFDRCIKGVLKGRVCVLVTHQLLYAQEADRLLVMTEGSIKAVGSFMELRNANIDFDHLLPRHPASSTTQVVSISTDHESPSWHTACSDKVSARCPGLTTQHSATDGLFRSTEALHTACTYLPPFLANDEQCDVHNRECGQHGRGTTHSESGGRTEPEDVDALLLSPRDTLVGEARIEGEPEQVAEGGVEWAAYKRYFGSGVHCAALIFLTLLMACGQASFIVIDWFVTDWSYITGTIPEQQAACLSSNWSSTANSSNPDSPIHPWDNLCEAFNVAHNSSWDNSSVTGNASTAVSAVRSHITDVQNHVNIYVALLCTAVVLSISRALLFYKVCSKASVKLHDSMLSAILHTPMRFFDTNPVGRILNRFSSDVAYMDDYLPIVYYDFFVMFMVICGTVIMAAIINPWVLLPLVPLGVVLVLIRKVYVSTSRSMKRLEAVTRSPVLSHVSTTITGIQTLRAFEAEEMFHNVFYTVQDGHTEAFYLFLCVNRWMAIRMDFVCIIFVTCITLLCIIAKESIRLDPSMFALMVSYALSMTVVFQYAIRQSIEVETLMTSVERIIDYSKLPKEGAQRPSVPPPFGWPHEGSIEAINARLQYYAGGPPVLTDVSFLIHGGEKVGICGRTGAGKSSLLAALFRLCEPSGHLTIDGVQVTELSLQDLRSNLSIIPQDPLLFSGTIRSNLDPLEQHGDDELWDALRQVQLAPAVEILPGGIDGIVSESGSNFSVGQRQLLCLARALLRKNKIVVIDEATANVDLRTSATIQDTIRQKFSSCTVLTIAHRLDAMMDMDRIMVLDSGRIEEFEEPHVLLQKTDSLFHALVRKSGRDFNYLRRLAKDSFEKRHAGDAAISM